MKVPLKNKDKKASKSPLRLQIPGYLLTTKQKPQEIKTERTYTHRQVPPNLIHSDFFKCKPFLPKMRQTGSQFTTTSSYRYTFRKGEAQTKGKEILGFEDHFENLFKGPQLKYLVINIKRVNQYIDSILSGSESVTASKVESIMKKVRKDKNIQEYSVTKQLNMQLHNRTTSMPLMATDTNWRKDTFENLAQLRSTFRYAQMLRRQPEIESQNPQIQIRKLIGKMQEDSFTY